MTSWSRSDFWWKLEGSYLRSNRNSPKCEWIENAPLVILISTEQFNSLLVLGSSGENVHRFGAFLSTVLFAYRPPFTHWGLIIASYQIYVKRRNVNFQICTRYWNIVTHSRAGDIMTRLFWNVPRDVSFIPYPHWTIFCYFCEVFNTFASITPIDSNQFSSS